MLYIYSFLIALCLLTLLFFKVYDKKYQKELNIFVDKVFTIRKGMSYEDVVDILKDKGDFLYIKLEKEPMHKEEEYYWTNKKYSRAFGHNAIFVARFENNVLVNSRFSSNSLFL